MSVWTSDRDGNDRRYLDTLGKVSGLQWETTLPGGDRSASWAMRLTSNQDFPACRQGRKVGITIGGQDLWTGDLSEPQPSGVSRSFTAEGSSVELARFIAAPGVSNVWTLTGGSGTVATAQARGMTVTSGTLYDAPYGQAADNDGSKTVDQAVNDVADLLGYTWQVNGGALSMFPYPTDASYIVLAQDQGSRSLNDFVTDLIVRYDDGATITAVSVSNGQGSLRGYREATLDLSANGTLTLAQATAIGQLDLARRGSRTKFSSPITVQSGQILNLGGSPVDPRTIRAGCVVSVQGLDVARGGEPDGSAPQILIGSVVCDYGTRSAVLTPYDYTGKTLTTALAGGFRSRFRA